MSGETGNRVLMGASAGATLIAILAIVAEIMTDRWLARSAGFPVFMSAPLGVCGLVLALRAWQTLGKKPGLVLVSGALFYWVLFTVGMMR